MTEQSPKEIEREIEAERAELARTLEDLQDTVSPEALVDKAETRLREDGGAVLKMVADRVAANPLAAAVTAAGLAWLMFGPADGASRGTHTPRSRLPGRARPRDTRDDERNRRRAAQWLMSHDPDPDKSLRIARNNVSPRVAQMIDRFDDGMHELPPGARANVRRARLRAVSARMVSERTSAAQGGHRQGRS